MPAKVPEIDLKLKPEFSNKIFYCPEPIRSITDQAIIDQNAADIELLAADRAYLNPFSKHNIGQVITCISICLTKLGHLLLEESMFASI